MLNALSRFLRPMLGAGLPDDVVWLTPELAQSDRFVSHEASALAGLAIGAVLDLRGKEGRRLAPLGKARLHYLHVPVADDNAPTEEELALASDWVLHELADDRKVLVHCSPARGCTLAVLAAVLLRMGYSLPDAVTLLGQYCPQAGLSDAEVAVLQRYAQSLPR